MNLREGTRRLALLLGVVGAIGGGFVSYLELQDVLNQRARHSRFDQLATSDVVKQERKILQAWTPAPGSPQQVDPETRQRIRKQPYSDIPAGAVVVHDPGSQKTYLDPKTGEPVQSEDPYASRGGVALDWSTFIHIPSEVNKGGVGTINWGTNYSVASIVTEDGQTLSPTPSPAAWQYLSIVLCPIFGFLIPWGAVRAIGWVGAGFVAKSV